MSQRTITLTGRPPVQIREEEWELVACARWSDNPRVPSESNRSAAIRVRRHADGRCIVYGTRSSSFADEANKAGGYLLDADAYPDGVVEAIGKVGSEIGHYAIVQECIADLPAGAIDAEPATETVYMVAVWLGHWQPLGHPEVAIYWQAKDDAEGQRQRYIADTERDDGSAIVVAVQVPRR
jgi:hypothetical protein